MTFSAGTRSPLWPILNAGCLHDRRAEGGSGNASAPWVEALQTATSNAHSAGQPDPVRMKALRQAVVDAVIEAFVTRDLPTPVARYREMSYVSPGRALLLDPVSYT